MRSVDGVGDSGNSRGGDRDGCLSNLKHNMTVRRYKTLNRREPLADQFKPGDFVEWKTPQGKTTGKVKQKLTSPTQIKGHHVAASEDNPEYLVESDKTGNVAAHKPDALKKVEE